MTTQAIPSRNDDRSSAWRRLRALPGYAWAVGGAIPLFAFASWGILRQAGAGIAFDPKISPLLEASAAVQIHVAGALGAFGLGLALLFLPKGVGLHKPLGWTWVALMGVTAVSSFFITGVMGDHYSPIHLLSGWVLIGLPMGIAAIRRRDVARHRRHMVGMYFGGMLIAGLFTFLPGRLMWSMFFSLA